MPAPETDQRKQEIVLAPSADESRPGERPAAQPKPTSSAISSTASMVPASEADASAPVEAEADESQREPDAYNAAAEALEGHLLWKQMDLSEAETLLDGDDSSFASFFAAGKVEGDLQDLDEATMNCAQAVVFLLYKAGKLEFSDIQDSFNSKDYASATDLEALMTGEAAAAESHSVEDTLAGWNSRALLDEHQQTLASWEQEAGFLWDAPESDSDLVTDTLSSCVDGWDQTEFNTVANAAFDALLSAFEATLDSANPASGQMVLYGIGEITSHYALSLGGGKLASLNGEGAQLARIELSDVRAALPTLGASDPLTSLEQLRGLTVRVYDPFWE